MKRQYPRLEAFVEEYEREIILAFCGGGAWFAYFRSIAYPGVDALRMIWLLWAVSITLYFIVVIGVNVLCTILRIRES